MFNAPRPAQRYVATTNNGLGGSFVDENPLASSVYDDGLDPWSAAPSPTPTPAPRDPGSVFNSVIGSFGNDLFVSILIQTVMQRTPPYLLYIIGHLLPSTPGTLARRL